MAIGRGGPARDGFNVRGGYFDAVFVTQQVLEKDFDRKGESTDTEVNQGGGGEVEVAKRLLPNP